MSIYNHSVRRINSDENLMDTLKGKILLVVNVASKFGYTPTCSPVWSYARTSRMLWELQQVHNEFKDRGFSVLAFPCNQFSKMEPGTDEEIASFIKMAYPFVDFPITEKIEVNGDNEHPIYSILKGVEIRRNDDNRADYSNEAQQGHNKAGAAMARIPHNYEKFLVSREGSMIGRFNWQALPLDKEPLTMGAPWTVREAIEAVV